MQQPSRSIASFSSVVIPFLYEAAVTNTLVRFASVLALGLGVTSCVPAKSYDEARTAAESEFTAHGRTRTRLEAAHERIRVLEKTLAERERALESGESMVAETKLENIVVGKDKEAALALVEQLRSELARTGNHLAAYSNEKRNLAQALLMAEERVRAIEAAEKNMAELVATARDLSLAFGPGMQENGIEVGAKGGDIVLSVPAAKLFAENSDSLVVDAASVLGAVSRVSGEHPTLRVALRAPDKTPLADQRISRLGAALRDRGVPDARLLLPSVPARTPEPTAAPVATEPAPSGATPETESAPVEAIAPMPAAPAPAPDPSARYEIAFSI